ncbi:MAG TPA: cell division protein ZapA [Bauldia sp.]|nr:cell division protein ZapA [Bauldia sp.]
MAQVNITISGKTYRMACDDGQEPHLLALGEKLNSTIEQLRERFGEIGDQRLTVMAAITMADQHSEAERRIEEAEGQVSGLRQSHAEMIERQDSTEAEIARLVDSMASRLEALADRLSRRDAPSDRE